MSQYIDFEQHYEERKLKRANNRESSPKILQERGITFELKNNGAHLVVTHNNKVADFWPGTGKYQVRGSGKYKRGVFNLLKDLEAVQ